MADDEENERRQAWFDRMDEAKKAAKSGKKGGLGGLSPEKKKLLKQLIMEKAAEEMKAEALKKAAEKEAFIKSKVAPLDGLDGMNKSQLESKIKDLYSKWKHLEEEKYDCEMKIRKQDFEINDLNAKVSDIKGKFVKPVLKKVSKTESKLARFGDKKGGSSDFRNSLKSTGQSKYQLDEKEEGSSKVDFRAELKPKEEGEAEAEAEAEAE